ncbi:MAG: glucose-6-phosphate dehydrogenase [Myxococcales bacterium]|nr:glucose-6-phosphate dehydrogenase [Myxococcales bacterium]
MANGTVAVTATAAAGDPLFRERRPEPCVVVIFGANGDLTHRKLVPALYNLSLDGLLPQPEAVIGFSRSAKTDAQLRTELEESTARFSRSKPLDAKIWSTFASSLHYVSGTFEDPASFERLAAKVSELEERLGLPGNRLFYLATPPRAFAQVLEGLKGAGLLYSNVNGTPWSRVIIEKPFGRDLESARALNKEVLSVLDERQVYRIDHYLGKETVQNILVFRFGNAIFEPLWNRKYIDHIQITAAEEVVVGTRGGFYDKTGVVRDVVQNHLLQLLALVAMEQPISFRADEIRNEKVKVLRTLQPIYGSQIEDGIVFGQYRGYHDEKDVAPGSRTPTYVALKAEINNWRWQGVPFYIRAGKGLKTRDTEIAIHFQSLPLCLFGKDDACQRLSDNVLTIQIQPDEGIDLEFNSKAPGDDLTIGNVMMRFTYAGAFAKQPSEAYERLILDAMRGDATLFDRSDGVEAAWDFIAPINAAYENERDQVPHSYEIGSEGPAEAAELLRRDRRLWRPL